MHRIKAWIRAFFGFSRTETNAFLILLPLMVAILFSEPAYRWWRTSQPLDFSKDQQSLDSLIASLHWVEKDSLDAAKAIPEEIKFFSFDPNTVSEKEFVTIGLSSFMATRVIHYREKGGTFRKKEDLLKIFGMDSSWFRKAKPWISIQQKTDSPKVIASTKKMSPPAEIVDINTADSLQLVKVYGIGPVLSKRIRTYRDKLGGFVRFEQLQEVYGLDTAVVRQMKRKFIIVENFQPQKINLNTATWEKLKHPYIKRNEAQAILSFRLQHGRFQSTEQLNEIKVLTPAWIERMKPYLTLD